VKWWSGLDDEGEAFTTIWICVSGSGMHGTVSLNTKSFFFSLMVQSQTQNYLSDERYSHPCSTRIEKGLDHRPKRPAIYLKSQGQMFLIAAEGIDILRATYFVIKVHGRSKCWCTMDKVSDKKVQRRASHKKRV
jgi:hypothetical protein